MKHRIDPKIDCVFKALLGSEENKDLLIHFLNAVLGHELGAPVTDVVIRDPHNGKESLNDKLSIVDVKAKDASGRLFQVKTSCSSTDTSPHASPMAGPTSTVSSCSQGMTTTNCSQPIRSGS